MRTSVRFPARVSLEQILDGLQRDMQFQEMVTRWERLPAKPAHYAPFPPWLDGRIAAALRRRGINELSLRRASDQAVLDGVGDQRHAGCRQQRHRARGLPSDVVGHPHVPGPAGLHRLAPGDRDRAGGRAAAERFSADRMAARVVAAWRALLDEAA